jgi:hypothetical protein
MGLVGYYRRFIKGFSKIVHPITSLQRKGKKFVWSTECEAIFQSIEASFDQRPCFEDCKPHEKYFLVCTDACKKGLGGFLMQEGKVICYESQKLNEHEKWYVTHDLELAMDCACIKYVEALLAWKKVFLDDRSLCLKYLFDQPQLNTR